MKTTLKQSIPETIQGLRTFIDEIDKEIVKYSRLRKDAQEILDIKSGKPAALYGLVK